MFWSGVLINVANNFLTSVDAGNVTEMSRQQDFNCRWCFSSPQFESLGTYLFVFPFFFEMFLVLLWFAKKKTNSIMRILVFEYLLMQWNGFFTFFRLSIVNQESVWQVAWPAQIWLKFTGMYCKKQKSVGRNFKNCHIQ